MTLTDITEHSTAEGKLYLCAVQDACSKRIVGYSIGARMTSDLAVDALSNALALRGAAGAIVHSDRGSQGGLNRSLQHWLIEVIVGVVRGLRRVSSSRGPSEVDC